MNPTLPALTETAPSLETVAIISPSEDRCPRLVDLLILVLTQIQLVDQHHQFSRAFRTTLKHLAQSPGTPTQLCHNGSLYSKPEDTATTLHEYFLSKVELIKQNLPPPISNLQSPNDGWQKMLLQSW